MWSLLVCFITSNPKPSKLTSCFREDRRAFFSRIEACRGARKAGRTGSRRLARPRPSRSAGAFVPPGAPRP